MRKGKYIMARTERNTTLVTTSINGEETQVPQWILDAIEKDESDRIDSAYGEKRLELLDSIKDEIEARLIGAGDDAFSISGWEIKIEFGMKQGKVAIMAFDKTKKRTKK